MGELVSTQHLKRTKMVCTIGPACDSYEGLERLVDIGMNAARLNFSHGSYDEFERIIHDLRALSDKYKKPIAIIQDLQGPRIRVAELAQPITLAEGESIYLGQAPDGNMKTVPVQFNFIPFLQEGHSIYFDDGGLVAHVKEVHEGYAVIKFDNAGTLSSNKGINIPDTHLANATLTEKDKQDIWFGLRIGVEYIALSFVQTAEDIYQARSFINTIDQTVMIIAKIETKSAIEHIDEIIEASDAVMIARGDLAVEIGMENVPVQQITIIQKAKKMKKPVIVATQMLESMMESPIPTRAEVNDVANAAISEADAVMLSGESAVGKYPFQAAETMQNIVKTTENLIIDKMLPERKFIIPAGSINADAISAAAALIANQMNSELLAVATLTGKSALSIAALRPSKIIIALAHSQHTYNQLALVWGTKSFHVRDDIKAIDELIDCTIQLLFDAHYIEKGSKIIFITGLHVGVEGETNSLRIVDV